MDSPLAFDGKGRNVFTKRSIFMAIDKPDNEDVVTKPALAAFLEREGYEVSQEELDDLWSSFEAPPDGKVDHVQFFVSTHFDPFFEKLQKLKKKEEPRLRRAPSHHALKERGLVGEIQSTFESLAEEDRRRKYGIMRHTASSPQLKHSSDDIGRDSRRASLGAPLSRSSSPLRPASPAPTIRTELVEPQNTDSSNTMDTLKSLKEDVRRLTEEIQSVKKTLSTRASQGEKEIDQIEDRVSMLERSSSLSKKRDEELEHYSTKLTEMFDALKREIENSLEAVKSEVVGAMNQISSIKAEMEQLTAKFATADNLHSQIDAIQSTLKTQQEQLVSNAMNDLVKRVDGMQEELALLEQRVNNHITTALSQFYDEFTGNTRSLATKVDQALDRVVSEMNQQLETQIVGLSEVMDDRLEKTRLKLKTTEEQCMTMEKSINGVLERLSTVSSTVNRLEKELEVCTKKLSSLALNETVATLHNELTELREYVQTNPTQPEAQQLLDRMASLETEVSSFRSSIASLQQNDVLERLGTIGERLDTLEEAHKRDPNSNNDAIISTDLVNEISTLRTNVDLMVEKLAWMEASVKRTDEVLQAQSIERSGSKPDQQTHNKQKTQHSFMRRFSLLASRAIVKSTIAGIAGAVIGHMVCMVPLNSYFVSAVATNINIDNLQKTLQHHVWRQSKLIGLIVAGVVFCASIF